MAVKLAGSFGKLETTGLAAIIFAPLMNVTGSILANYWRRFPCSLAAKSANERLEPEPTDTR
jgi:BASS family bile acid:Na+ symporter